MATTKGRVVLVMRKVSRPVSGEQIGERMYAVANPAIRPALGGGYCIDVERSVVVSWSGGELSDRLRVMKSLVEDGFSIEDEGSYMGSLGLV